MSNKCDKNYEMEYKYLVDRLPLEFEYKKRYIEQRYFITNDNKNKLLMSLTKLDSLDNINTFRVRKITEEKMYYILTLKSKGDLSREEYEVEISESDYNYLSEEVESEIIKNRYIISVNDFVFEFDEYLNLKEDLLTAEVEVDTLDEKLKLDIELIMKDVLKVDFTDVTNEKKYKNKYLAETFGIK